MGYPRRKRKKRTKEEIEQDKLKEKLKSKEKVEPKKVVKKTKINDEPKIYLTPEDAFNYIPPQEDIKSIPDEQVKFFELCREDPVFAAQNLLYRNNKPVQFAPHQRLIMRSLWTKQFNLLVLARGAGKTYLMALFCILRAMLYPREKCVIVSATYRQAQFVFDEIVKFYDESPLFKQACSKPPTKGPNSCEIQLNEGGRIIAYPLGDGTKIRGARAQTLVIDEVAQVDNDIIDMVILPILNTKGDPFSNDGRSNSLVLSSSAYYTFNHLYARYLIYKDRTDPRHEKYSENYGLHQYSYTDMIPGWYDQGVLDEAKAKLTEIQFMMEYGAMFPPDSDGFFPASLMAFTRKAYVIIQEKAQAKGEEFVFGIDPARTGDNFALSVVKLGPPNKLVAEYTLNKATFQEMHRFIREKMRDYEKNDSKVLRIQMDLGGGGQTLRDMLSEPYAWFDQERNVWEELPAILEIENDEFKHHVGRRMLVLQVFSPQTINTMNFDLKNDFEKGNLILPLHPPDENTTLPYGDMFYEIEEAISEIQTIVTTPLKNGYMHFDTPKQRMKKDRYSSILLGAEGARQIQWVDKTPLPKELACGFSAITYLNH